MKAYDSAYPGNMRERVDGEYVRRDDPESLTQALLELLAKKDRELEDLQSIAQKPLTNPKLVV